MMGSVRRLGRTLLRVLQTRLEILSTEITDERLNLTRLAMVALIVLFCVQTGLMLAIVFIVLAVSPEHRLMAIGITALALLLGAGLGAGVAAVAFVRPGNISDWVRRGRALWRALASGTRSAARPPETKVEPSAGGIPT